MRGKTLFLLLIPVLITILFSAFIYLPFYRNFEKRIYDLFLSIKPEIEEDERILLLDVDDLAISEVGVWPWSRDIMANGLLLLREFDARSVLFDIEYTEESPMGVNSRVLREEIPELFGEEFSEIRQNIGGLFDALEAGQIPMEEAGSYIQDLQQLTEESREVLLSKVQEIARDNDEYYGKMNRLNGRTFFTVGMLPEEDPAVPDSLVEYALEEVALDNVSGDSSRLRVAEGIRPAIRPILEGAVSAGFPNVKVDEDGVRRRIDLLMKYDGEFFPQLAFSPLLRWLGMPDVEVSSDKIRLLGAEHPDEGETDITIPLTEEGHVLINWPHKGYSESFRHLSFYELVYNRELEERLIGNLEIMEEAGYLSYHEGDFAPMDAYRYAEDIKQEVLEGGDPELMEEYAEVRAQFFPEVGKFLNGPAEETIDDEIERILSSGEDSSRLDEETAESYREIREELPEVFGASRDVYGNIAKSRERLSEAVDGSFSIIGHVGTSTTDIGVTPFAEEYMNVGTHASLVNTILQENFIDELPEWHSMLLALAASILVALIIWRMSPSLSILTGVLFLFLVVGADLAAFVGTGVYLPPLIPASSIFFTIVAITVIKFIREAKDRVYIKNAFSHYLSSDVINDLLSDPDKLSLGGDKKYLTALFTDIKGFSTISEKMDPSDLVSLLNEYLTEMSDIIMDQRGTIDKYEGDAIISFFGAPIEYEDHAARACSSAILMKKAEEELNNRFISGGIIPTPVFTRIGINTGEMVVGNMGTARKMDYTIMGNSVNLAARLEGVNKQYGTWILVSEPTFNEAGSEFAARRLDRVRVVGINEPVRLYELLDERGSLSPHVGEAMEIFEKGLEAFEKRQWKEAKRIFSKVLELLPEDGPSKFYITRCDKFISKAPPESWDGVFNLDLK
ncbi:MAG: CHASE2 domain-containing protein [Spirochaetaceae bacterium]